MGTLNFCGTGWAMDAMVGTRRDLSEDYLKAIDTATAAGALM